MARPMEEQMGDRVLYRLTWLALAMSLGHHLDYLLRGNAVGWPVSDLVNAFTVSLVVYPIIATGRGPAPTGTEPGAVVAGRRHRGGRLGWRACPVPAAGQRRRSGLGVRRLPGGVGAAVPGRLDRPVPCPGRRLLPIMAARWVFNAGTALALPLGLVA